MATPSSSSIVNFVKKYPITLCGFSLLFMPSVHRLLLYFTPLLLSTAIFIVAMLTWGPSAETSSQRSKRSEWAFNGSLKVYGDEDDEEEEAEADSSIDAGKASKKPEAQMLEPDPDFDEESKRVGTASTGALFRGLGAEPDPDLGADAVETVSNGAPVVGDMLGGHVGSAARSLQGDCVGTASDPDPDLHGEQHVDEAAHTHNSPAGKLRQLHSAPDHHPHDHAKPASISEDEQVAAAGDHPGADHDAEPDHDDYHDAASDQANQDDDSGDLEANQGDDYHDAEPNPDLQGSDGGTAPPESEEAGPGARVENDDVRAAIAELRQKLGLVQRAPFEDVDAREHMLSKGFQTLQAAA